MPGGLLRLSPDHRERIDRLAQRLRTLDSSFRVRALRTPGLRIAYRIGLRRAIRAAGIAVWVVAVIAVPTATRPELIHPADIGSDQSNYLAAAERLAAGHDIYKLVPGDRPAPLDNPPEWSVPILSPPAVATFDLWKLSLPDTARFYPAWALGLGATVALGLFLMAMGPIVLVPLLIILSEPLAVTAWSGNLNALIGPGIALVWWASQQSSGRWQLLAGVIVALGACVKIGPVMLGVWLLAQRRFVAVAGGVVVGLLVLTLTIVLAGPGVVPEYLGVVRSTSATPTPLSIPGFLQGIGLEGGLVSAALPTALIAAAAFIFIARRSPISFALAVLAMTFSTAVVREETISIALVAGIAWIATADTSRTSRVVRPRHVVAASAGLGAATVVLALASSLTTGGGDRSTVAISNSTELPVIVRFSLFSQSGTFGYLVPPGSAIYGWSDLPGGAPPVMTVWTSSCDLIELVEVPRTGASFEVDETDVRQMAEVLSPSSFGAYVPDCATRVSGALKAR